MEGAPPTAEVLQQPDLLAVYGARELSIFGITGQLSQLAEMCPKDLTAVDQTAMNDFVIKAGNEAGWEIAPEHESIFRETAERQGLEVKFTIGTPKPEAGKDQPQPPEPTPAAPAAARQPRLAPAVRPEAPEQKAETSTLAAETPWATHVGPLKELAPPPELLRPVAVVPIEAAAAGSETYTLRDYPLVAQATAVAYEAAAQVTLAPDAITAEADAPAYDVAIEQAALPLRMPEAGTVSAVNLESMPAIAETPTVTAASFGQALEKMRSLFSDELANEALATPEGAASAETPPILAAVSERLDALTPEAQELIAPVLQRVTTSIKTIHALKLTGASPAEVTIAALELEQLCADLFDAIGLQYTAADLKQFMQVLLRPEFQPSLAENTETLDLEYSGMREVKQHLRQRFINGLTDVEHGIEHYLGVVVLGRVHSMQLEAVTA